MVVLADRTGTDIGVHELDTASIPARLANVKEDREPWKHWHSCCS